MTNYYGDHIVEYKFKYEVDKTIKPEELKKLLQENIGVYLKRKLDEERNAQILRDKKKKIEFEELNRKEVEHKLAEIEKLKKEASMNFSKYSFRASGSRPMTNVKTANSATIESNKFNVGKTLSKEEVNSTNNDINNKTQNASPTGTQSSAKSVSAETLITKQKKLNIVNI